MHIIAKKENSSSQKTDKSFIYGAVIKWTDLKNIYILNFIKSISFCIKTCAKISNVKSCKNNSIKI